MIFRKPYAFLIKNFRKIHILLLALVIYIYYKQANLYTFLKEYVAIQSYNSSLESIDNYVSPLVFLILFIIILISGLLIYLLLYKKKPWKLYLVIVLEYILMFVGFSMAVNFFHNYDATVSVSNAMAIRDIIFIASLGQYLVLIILIIRITGIDLNKFDFAHDQEFMELSEEDREEFEINIDIDKESFKRKYRGFKRNFHYFYQEHKFLVKIFIIIMVMVLGFSTYYSIFVINKKYSQGETFKAINYAIKINRAYLTDTNSKGEKITNSNFIVLDITAINNGATRSMNVERFHVVNKDSDFVPTGYYNKDFKDLGKPYEKFDFKKGAKKQFLLIYKVPKKLKKDNFSLYYQSITNDSDSKLIKIKLKLEDIRSIKTISETKIGEEQTLEEVKGTKQSIILKSAAINDEFKYNYSRCLSDGSCSVTSDTVQATNGNKILKIEQISTTLDDKELVDFSMMYGKIIYKDSNGETKEIALKNAIDRSYLGSVLFLAVPAAINDSEKVDFVYTLRNKRYLFNII